MTSVRGKEDHHDRFRVDQCRAVRGNLDPWFGWSVSDGNGEAGGEVIPERGSCERTSSATIKLHVLEYHRPSGWHLHGSMQSQRTGLR